MRAAKRGISPALGLAGLVVATGSYVIAAWAVSPGFFDGFAPPAPYRWASPPPQFKSQNQPPLAGHGETTSTPSGVALANGILGTADNQAFVSFVPGTLVSPPGGAPVKIDIEPVYRYPDPGSVQLATNVYCISSTSPIAPGREVVITLSYSTGITAPTDIYEYQDSQPWQKIGTTGNAAPYSISAPARQLGCFAAGGAKAPPSPTSPAGGTLSLPWLVAILVLVVVLAALPLIVLRGRRR